MAGITEKGEEKAWELLRGLEPQDVCRTAGASYDAARGRYVVPSYGMEFSVNPHERTITSTTEVSSLFLGRLGEFFRLSLLWYLVSAKDIPCSGRLVKLENISGGDIFTRGSHVLPLEKLSSRYARDRDGFIRKGRELCGETVSFGDAAIRLLPVPRLPMVLVLWLEDEEFPARADLLLDSTCGMQLATDIIWSVAMMTVLAMLQDE